MISLFGNRSDESMRGWFDDHSERWVEHRLVSSEQVAAIREFEHVNRVSTSEPQAPAFSVATEVAIYLGSLLALISGAVMVGQSWDSLGIAGQIAIGVAIAMLGFLAASRMIRLDEPGGRRLASFMWVIATGGVALTIGAIVDAVGPEDEPGWYLLAIGAPVAVIGAALWRNLDRPLQVLTTAVGIGLAIGGVLALLDVTPWIAGIAVWLSAPVIVTLAVTRRLRPELYVTAVAAATGIIGAAMLSDLSETAAMWVATLTAAAIVVLGLARHLVPILVIGVLVFVQTLLNLLMTTLHGPIAAMAVTVIGIGVVVAAITRSTRGKPSDPPTTPRGPTQVTL